VLGVAVLAAGCTAVVGGKAQPAPNVTARPLSGSVIKEVLLDDAALSRLLEQPFRTDAHFPPRLGGPDQLQDDGPASSVGCLGVAVESWLHAARSVKVVSLPTGAAADALFARFAEQRRKCAGTTLPLPGSAVRVTAKITDVRDANSVLVATVSMGLTVPSSDPAAIAEGRAVGVRGNCLVEVEIDFFNTSNPSHQGSGDVDTSAAEIAHALLDRVSALS
jgi:hypothetical protein